MSTRQLRRAQKRRGPKRRNKGLIAFTAGILALLLAGGAAVALLRTGQDAGPERGAIIGEHWHAAYRIEICEKRLEPYPFVQGEVHTHGDGQIHIHPNTRMFANENANLGAFFRNVESGIGRTPDGDRFLVLPDGSRYTDGDTCPGSEEPQELEVLVDGEPITGDPAEYTPHEGESIVVRFGPEAIEETANPLRPEDPAAGAPEEGEAGPAEDEEPAPPPEDEATP